MNFIRLENIKSIVFKKVLGIDQSDASLLKDLIIKGLSNAESETREKDQYGERFTVDIKISIFDKEALVTTGWIIRQGEDFPRLTSCYIKKK